MGESNQLAQVFTWVLDLFFWLSVVATVVTVVILICAIIARAFQRDIDTGIKSILGVILAFILCFVFYRYNTNIVEALASFHWLYLAGGGFVLALAVIGIVNATDLRYEASVAAVFCFALTSGLLLGLLIFIEDQSQTNDSIFLPLGFFVGAVVFIIFSKSFSFSKLVGSGNQRRYTSSV